MPLFDTHCHFETEDSAAVSAVLVRAKSAGVGKVLAVGGGRRLNAGVKAAAAAAAGRADMPEVLCAVGFDRDHAAEADDPSALPDLPRALSAWGEIGLDYHYSPETRLEQTELFASQLEEARRRNLPAIVHTREAADDTFAILREVPSRGVIHCFTGTPEEAKRYLDLGFYISISGIVTFRAAANVRETALAVPDDRILIETDSPFLAPVPFRGKPNEPAFVARTCEFLAELRGMPPEEFAGLVWRNAERMLA